MTPSVNTKQIAKNAVYLYIRTFLVILIMIFSSRVLLKALGTEDFGLYNLVGSIVAMFTSLRVVFASATQRFLNYERPKNDIQILSNIFTISKRLHLLLGIIFVIITETLGIWMIHNQLNIPDGKMTDAYIILQCSIFSAIATLMTVPYDAIIISNEKFNAYAYLAIIECALQLVAAYITILIPNNALIWYSIMILSIAIIVRIINMAYCHIVFPECKEKGYLDKNMFKEMGKFAGWNFLGNFALSIYLEGINMILNIFGGVIANAARAISNQILKGIGQISDKLTSAFAPQATQQYAAGNHDQFHNLIFLSSKIINYLYIILAIPIAIFTPLVLEIWLDEVPQYSVEFVRASLIYGFARAIHSPLDLCFKSYGELRKYQIIEICTLLPTLPIAYILLNNGLPLYYALLSMALTNFINDIFILILAKKDWAFRAKDFIIKTIFPSFVVCIVSLIFSAALIYTIKSTIIQIIGVIIIIVLSIAVGGFDKKERGKIKSFIIKRI